MALIQDPKGNYIKIMGARLSFPHLFEPQLGDDGKNPKYNGLFIMAPTAPEIAEITSEIKRVAKEKWPLKHEEMLKRFKASGKLCMQKGEVKAQYEGFEGNVYVSASNKTKIKIFNRAGEMITEGCAGAPYAGCFVNVSVELWAQDNAYGQRVNMSLRAVQFDRDGEPFGGGAIAKDDEFGDLGEGATGDVPDASAEDGDSLI